jgi:F-type H+-transporting ATPase subunit b
MKIISTIALISINETLIVQVVSFLIFLVVMNRLMFRPLRNVMADRDNHVERIKLDIGEARQKVIDIQRQIRRQEREARQAALKIKEDLEESGEQQAGEIFKSMRREITGEGQRVKKEIESSMAAARQSAQREAEIIAQGIIVKILDRRPRP